MRPRLILCVAFLAGCAGHPVLTQDDWLRTKTRVYEGKTPREVVAATERLFRLADGQDFTLGYAAASDRMTASRRWFIPLGGFGHEDWTIAVTPQPDGTRVGVDVNAAMGSFFLLIIPFPEQPIDVGPAVYDLFFSRLDYLLGRSKDWRTCEMPIPQGPTTWGTLDPLCMLADDKTPDVAGVIPVAAPPSR